MLVQGLLYFVIILIGVVVCLKLWKYLTKSDTNATTATVNEIRIEEKRKLLEKLRSMGDNLEEEIDVTKNLQLEQLSVEELSKRLEKLQQ